MMKDVHGQPTRPEKEDACHKLEEILRANANLPYSTRMETLDDIKALKKTWLDEDKKERANAKALALKAAEAAAASGAKFVVQELGVGVDAKAAQAAIKAFHKVSKIPVMFIGTDPSAKKTTVLIKAEVPKAASKTLSAADWVQEVAGLVSG